MGNAHTPFTEERFIRMLERVQSLREATEPISPKARLMAALECKTPDRVPICLPGFHLYRWADRSYDDLLEAIARYADPVYDVFLGYDPITSLPNITVLQDTLPNGRVLHRVATPKGEMTQITHPYSGGSNHPNRAKLWIETPDDAQCFLSLPYEASKPDLSRIMEIQERLGEMALTVVTINEPMECINGLMGTTNFCLWSLERRELIKELLDLLFGRIMQELDYLLRQGLGPVYRISGGEMVIPPIMALKAYKEYAAPYAEAMIAKIHSFGCKAVVHCHSSVSQLLETFIELGADGTDPCEPPPIGDVDLVDAKQRVRGRLSLWGNIEYHVLAEATEQEIEDIVRNTIAHGAPGGGFVLLPCARLYETTIPEKTKRNLFRFLKAARECWSDTHYVR